MKEDTKSATAPGDQQFNPSCKNGSQLQSWLRARGWDASAGMSRASGPAPPWGTCRAVWSQHQPTAGGTAGLCLPRKDHLFPSQIGEGLACTHVESGLNLHWRA